MLTFTKDALREKPVENVMVCAL